MRISSLMRAALALTMGPLACGTFANQSCCCTGADCLDPGVDPPKDDLPKDDPSKGEPRRYVAVVDQPGQGCPPVDGWSESPLYGDIKGVEALPPQMERYCVYTWSRDGEPTGAPEVPGASVEPDPPVVVPQQPSSLTTMQKEIDERRGELIVDVTGSKGVESPTNSPYDGSKPVAWVAIVDTVDFQSPADAWPSYDANPQLRHGLAMGEMIRAVRCPHEEKKCLGHQFFVNAFPPELDGGRREQGTVATLSHAVVEAVERWKSLRAPDEPLVINISLGWDLLHHQALNDSRDVSLSPNRAELSVRNEGVLQSSASLETAYGALAWAACQGALVIAATGNNRGARCDQQGTMGPAAFEAMPTPSAASCQSLGLGPAPQPVGRLVYGVGAVDSSAEPIALTRLGSITGRAAFGYQAHVELEGDEFSPPWTGTSVATAVVSAVAAQAWSYAPGRPAIQLMDSIDASATTTSVDPQWTAGGISEMPVITAYGALESIAGADNPYAPPPASISVESLTTAQQKYAQQLTPSTSSQSGKSTPVPKNFCAGVANGVFERIPGVPPFPDVTYLTDELRPQPPIGICPTCVVTTTTSGPSSPLSLFVEIDAAYASSTITQPTLTAYDTAGSAMLSVTLATTVDPSGPIRYPLDNYVLQSGETISDWLITHTSVSSARVGFMVEQGAKGPPAAIDVATIVR